MIRQTEIASDRKAFLYGELPLRSNAGWYYLHMDLFNMTGQKSGAAKQFRHSCQLGSF